MTVRLIVQTARLTMVWMLALLILAATPAPVLANDGSAWNPLNWFDSSERDAKKANKRAEEAKKQAEKALEEARRAHEAAQKAEEAAREAEARRSGLKPRLVPTEQVKTSVATPAAHEAPVVSGADTASGWNLINQIKGEESSASATTPPGAASAVSQPAERHKKAESTSGNSDSEQESSGGFSLRKLFSLPGSDGEPARAYHNDSPKQPAPAVDVSLKTKAAVLETEKGNIAFELYPDEAPITVNNFVKLVEQGFYNKFNMKFHRVVPDFVIQTGDPTGTGAGGSQEKIVLEAKNKLSHNAKGMVAMARGPDPNSASSQFYITLAPQTSLDGKYAIFGKVISGLDVLDKIEKDDMLYGIKLVDLKDIARDPEPEKKKLFSLF